MRIRPTGFTGWNRRSVEAAGGKFKNRLNLLPSDIVLLDDFLDARTHFEVFKNRSNRHPGVLENPGAAAAARHALHNGAL